MLLSSVLLIYQFRSLRCGLNFSQLAPFPYLYPYSVQTLSHVAWWGKEIWVSINKLEVLYIKSYGQRRYWTVLGTFDTNSWGWECDYPNPPTLTVGQHGNMQQMKRQDGSACPALPASGDYFWHSCGGSSSCMLYYKMFGCISFTSCPAGCWAPEWNTAVLGIDHKRESSLDRWFSAMDGLSRKCLKNMVVLPAVSVWHFSRYGDCSKWYRFPTLRIKWHAHGFWM